MKNRFLLSAVALSLMLLTSCKAQLLSTSEAMTQDDPVWGQADAPITMVVFSDFECPFCAEYFSTLESLQEDWIDTGKLKIQYRDFPLAAHVNSLPAHAAAAAADRQGKYHEMHKALFEKRTDWIYALDPETELVDMAVELGLDKQQFMKDVKDESLMAEIIDDRDDGRTLGIAGTPGTYINDKVYQGALSRENLITELEKAEADLAQ